jgi:hypothetical protein
MVHLLATCLQQRLNGFSPLEYRAKAAYCKSGFSFLGSFAFTGAGVVTAISEERSI